jgi:hypothetical protein
MKIIFKKNINIGFWTKLYKYFEILRLRQLDIEALKSLQSRVNIIPVIAKADTLTQSEMRALKDQVLEDLRANNIQVNLIFKCYYTKIINRIHFQINCFYIDLSVSGVRRRGG